MASAPSLSQETPASVRVSVVLTGEGPEPWLAEIDERPDQSGRGATPEEAVQRLWAATNSGAQYEEPAAEAPQHSGKLLVRMPATLHDELAHAAERDGVSLNQLITGILAGAVGWRSGDRSSENAIGGNGLFVRPASILLVANLVLIVVAAAIAMGLLVTAWT